MTEGMYEIVRIYEVSRKAKDQLRPGYMEVFVVIGIHCCILVIFLEHFSFFVCRLIATFTIPCFGMRISQIKYTQQQS
jgi:hypothetical protein